MTTHASFQRAALPTLPGLAEPVRIDVPRAVIVVLGLSFLMGLVARRLPVVATGHAGFLLLATAWITVMGRSRPWAMFVLGAVGSAGVFWRMHSVPLPWETGKYAAFACIVALWLRGRARAPAALPTLYFVLLLPSALLTIDALPWAELRRALSFNLSGPLLLAACGILVARDRLDLRTTSMLLLGLFAGCLLVLGAVSSTWIAGADVTYQSAESSFVASAGYGPNQVSTMLGLGLVLALMGPLVGAVRTPLGRAVCVGLALLFLGFALATLSRGGVYSGIIALGVFCVFGLPRSRTSIAALVGLVLAGVVAWSVVVPAVESATGGYLSQRYAEAGATGRERLALDDLKGFEEHPVLGRGPGMAAHERGVAAHSEVTRMLGEHGILGLLSLLALMAMGWRAVTRSARGLERAIGATMYVWGFTVSLHAGFRTATMGIALAMASAGIQRARRG